MNAPPSLATVWSRPACATSSALAAASGSRHAGAMVGRDPGRPLTFRETPSGRLRCRRHDGSGSAVSGASSNRAGEA